MVNQPERRLSHLLTIHNSQFTISPFGLAVLFVVVVAAAYADPLLFRRNFGGRDTLGGLLPMESAIHDAYSRGRLPVWASDISGGRPLLANPNTSALYPVRAALAAFPFPFAM